MQAEPAEQRESHLQDALQPLHLHASGVYGEAVLRGGVAALR